MRASEAAIPAVFWLVLLGGGAIVITFPLLFGIRNLRVQMLMVGMLAAMICAALFLAVVLDRPFTGDVRAEPTAFEEALRIMDPIMDPTPR
jgi:ABC-type branched-subunit amino acid transport system permease subunit